MTVEAWPSGLRYRALNLQLISHSKSGGQSIAGREQLVATPAQRWQASLELVIRTTAEKLAYRGLIARLGGKLNQLLTPVCDAGKPKGVTATLASTAAVNATAIPVTCAQNLEPGMLFSLPDGRLHAISAVVSHVGSAYVVAIEPWLRTSYAAGAALEFNAPLALMRLARDDTGALNLEQLRFAEPRLELVEAFLPAAAGHGGLASGLGGASAAAAWRLSYPGLAAGVGAASGAGRATVARQGSAAGVGGASGAGGTAGPSGLITGFTGVDGGVWQLDGQPVMTLLSTTQPSYGATQIDSFTVRCEVRAGDFAVWDNTCDFNGFSHNRSPSFTKDDLIDIDWDFFIEPGTFAPTGWIIMSEMHHESSSGPPPLSVHIDHGELYWNYVDVPGNLQYVAPFEGLPGSWPARNTWHNLKVQARFNNTGILKLWYNGTQYFNYSGTLGYNTNVYWMTDIYRAAMSETLAIRFRNIKVQKIG